MITTDDHDVVLTEERVVVSKGTMPVERVRVEKDTIIEEQQIELDQSDLTRGDQDRDRCDD